MTNYHFVEIDSFSSFKDGVSCDGHTLLILPIE